MSKWKCVAGSTLLLPSINGYHLHIILTDPLKYEGYKHEYCILACISSIKKKIPYDKTCIIEPGEHTFIKKKSFVYYNETQFLRESIIHEKVNDGIFIPKEPVSHELFKRAKQGLKKSNRTKKYLKQLKRAK